MTQRFRFDSNGTTLILEMFSQLVWDKLIANRQYKRSKIHFMISIFFSAFSQECIPLGCFEFHLPSNESLQREAVLKRFYRTAKTVQSNSWLLWNENRMETLDLVRYLRDKTTKAYIAFEISLYLDSEHILSFHCETKSSSKQNLFNFFLWHYSNTQTVEPESNYLIIAKTI